METLSVTLGDRESLCEPKTQASASMAALSSPKLSPVLLQLDRNTERSIFISFLLRQIERKVLC